MLKEFTKETGYTVKVLKSGDAGAALNQEILTKGSPQGDVFFGVDNTLLSRALDNDLFTPYEAKGLDQVPDELQLDTDKHRVTPVDTGDICVNYDKKYFADKKLAPPQTFDDLTKPAYKNLLVTENAATSSPGLGFLLGTVGKYGEDGWQDYWKKLKANGVKVVDGWEQAYNERVLRLRRRQEGQGATGRWSSRTPPARRPRCSYAKPQPTEAPDRRRDRHLLPPDRVRRAAERREERGGRQGAAGLPDHQAVPGGHAAQHVRQPGRSRTRSCPRCSPSSARSSTSRQTVAPDKIAKNREQWVQSWSSLVAEVTQASVAAGQRVRARGRARRARCGSA